VTAPNRFITDRNETVCISLHNLEESGDVHVTFQLFTRYYGWRPRENYESKVVAVETLKLSPNNDGECVS